MHTDITIISLDKTTRLLERLKTSNSPSWWSYSLVLFMALSYGGIAYLQGMEYLMLYCGILSVLFTSEATNLVQQSRQTKLINEILEELNKKIEQSHPPKHNIPITSTAGQPRLPGSETE